MTPNTAENATAGVPVVSDLEWLRRHGQNYLPSGECSGQAAAFGYKLIAVADELDTARAEIERLRERLRDIIDERDNLSTIIATEIDDVAGAELDDMEERATRAESALTAAQARIAELEAASRHILPYLKWTISDESSGHHPTMPSAVAAFEATLSPVKENDRG